MNKFFKGTSLKGFLKGFILTNLTGKTSPEFEKFEAYSAFGNISNALTKAILAEGIHSEEVLIDNVDLNSPSRVLKNGKQVCLWCGSILSPRSEKNSEGKTYWICNPCICKKAGEERQIKREYQKELERLTNKRDSQLLQLRKKELQEYIKDFCQTCLDELQAETVKNINKIFGGK